MQIDGGAVLQGVILLVVAWAGAGVREANKKLNALAERMAAVEAEQGAMKERQRDTCRYPNCPPGHERTRKE
jgi:hypothetical protein